MENLACSVGRICYVTTRRMPIGINTEAESLIGVGVVSSDCAIVVAQQSGTVLSTDVKAHVGWISTIEAVAIDTSLKLGVLNQSMFVERRKITLIYTHLAPYFIARLNESIAEAVVDAV